MRRLFGTPRLYAEPLTALEEAAFKNGRCPDCAGSMREGPHGGLSVNWICNRCARTFNASPLGVERIHLERTGAPQ